MSTTPLAPQQQGARDGRAAYHAGIECTPALDHAVHAFMEANAGEHRRICSYLNCWQRAWHEANLAAMVAQ